MSTLPQLPEPAPTPDAWELSLDARGLVDSGWPNGMEVPVRLNGNVAMTANFEVVGNRLALRVVEVI